MLQCELCLCKLHNVDKMWLALPICILDRESHWGRFVSDYWESRDSWDHPADFYGKGTFNLWCPSSEVHTGKLELDLGANCHRLKCVLISVYCPLHLFATPKVLNSAGHCRSYEVTIRKGFYVSVMLMAIHIGSIFYFVTWSRWLFHFCSLCLPFGMTLLCTAGVYVWYSINA